ncbi:MAG: DUF3943 domain-containing protein [Bacteroides sp.]|nr:DUF3943 domain-containing protein [Bacteroides sp.]MBD5361823.1 DUF3943 domain-containing protein [Bacteroides sp.]MBD5365299.1 DUF3943 domain-containing protein [Bacteroides sp.]
MQRRLAFFIIFAALTIGSAAAQSPAMPDTVLEPIEAPILLPPDAYNNTIYAYPEQNLNLGFSVPDWKRIWINAGVLTGCYVAALTVLEMLPEDATTWNRAALQRVPLGTRWVNHVIKEGPEWDHDNPMFNFVLHPYSGAAYFMAARSNGLSFWGSLLFSAGVSTICWEFGIEAFMERPSWQDIFITPLVGAVMGEGFFRAKRYLVANNYCLWGSPIIGNIVAFLVDPVNEVVGLIGGNPARKYARARHLQLQSHPGPITLNGQTAYGLTLTATF